MTPLFKKLNFKNQKSILVLNAPKSFDIELSEMQKIADVKNEILIKEPFEFVMVFAIKKVQVDIVAKEILSKLNNDSVMWVCYPKGTSKKYTCDFNRDNGWDAFGKKGFEPVRAVAVDEDWSALRFKKAELIKKFTRSSEMALTAIGKKRGTKK